MSKRSSKDGRWLVGWLLRLVGGSVIVGLGICGIGVLRQWGLEVPRATMITFAVLGVIGASLLGVGQALMHSAPRAPDDRIEEGL